MTKSRSLVFFGTEDFSLSALKALVDADYNVLCVVTKPDSIKGRGQKLKPSAVKTFANEIGIDVIQNPSMEEVSKELDNYKAEVAVLSAFGRIIPQSILDKYALGIINIHPSLLPRWRGASPIEQTILAGDKKAGVSLMKLVAKMDAGPVYEQKSIELDGSENSISLYKKLSDMGSALLIAKLDEIISGNLSPWEQNDTEATIAPMIKKSDAEIDWSQSAEKIDRTIRAYARWPGVRIELTNMQVRLIDSNVTDYAQAPKSISVSGDGILIGCGSGSVLITKLQPSGKRIMSAKEFLAGHKVI